MPEITMLEIKVLLHEVTGTKASINEIKEALKFNIVLQAVAEQIEYLRDRNLIPRIRLTRYEVDVLRAILHNDHQDGHNPVNNPIWAITHHEVPTVPKASLPGVMSSLVQKGAVKCDFQGKDATVFITQAGFDAYQNHPQAEV